MGPSKDAPVVIGGFPAPNRVAIDAAGNVIFDSYGMGYEITARDRRQMAIHAHTQNGIVVGTTGLAWCDAEACTSGWDGRVICTDPATGVTRVAAELHSLPPGLASGNGHCFTAAANGGVYDFAQRVRSIYTHAREPYRLAVSDDGRYEASGDWAGISSFTTPRSSVLCRQRVRRTRAV